MEPGQTIARYRVLEKLGEGGMGVVYKAHDTELNRSVALKVLPEDKAGHEGSRLRFVQEAQAASALNHPNIITIHDIVRQDSLWCIVMEHVEGKTLDQVIPPQGMKLGEALKIAVQIADALARAHAAGIVHRDLKPSNIMLDAQGNAKVLDFGLAKLLERPVSEDDETRTFHALTEEGTIAGTAAYMSPEQAEGQPIDARTDIFSFGSVLYEMLTGRQAFRRASRASTLAAVLRDNPSAPSETGAGLPPELERIISRCLQKDRERRFQTMADLRVALDEMRTESAAAGTRLAKPEKKIGWAWWAGAAVVAGAVALLAGFDVAGVRTAALQGLFPFRAESVAVLPLENASKDPQQEFFADGMTSALTANLGSLSQSRVISRSSVLRYKGKSSEVAAIGRELGVDAVVTGTAARAGPTVRIGLELHNAKSGRRLWTRTWERPAAQMPALQREVAEALARRIGSFVGEGVRLPVATAPVNEEAYEAYLRGRQLFEQWPRGLRAAAKQFLQAIEKDPLFAPAHAELALTFANLCYFVPPKEAALRAREAAQAALRLDPSAADAHLALAYVKFIHDWDWPGAERDLRKAIEINPNNTKAHHFYAGYLAAMGRVEESILEAKEARILDPMNRLSRVQLPWVYYLSRRYDDAIAQYQEMLKSDPQNLMAREQLGWCYTLMGRYPEARETFAPLPAGPDANRIYLDAISGRRREAEEDMRALNARMEKGYWDPYNTAIAYAGLGDRDRAFACLEKGIEVRSAQMPMIRTEPFFDPLRADPRFNQLLEKMKLPR